MSVHMSVHFLNFKFKAVIKSSAFIKAVVLVAAGAFLSQWQHSPVEELAIEQSGDDKPARVSLHWHGAACSLAWMAEEVRKESK